MRSVQLWGGKTAFEERRFVYRECQLLLSVIVVGFASP